MEVDAVDTVAEAADPLHAPRGAQPHLLGSKRSGWPESIVPLKVDRPPLSVAAYHESAHVPRIVHQSCFLAVRHARHLQLHCRHIHLGSQRALRQNVGHRATVSHPQRWCSIELYTTRPLRKDYKGEDRAGNSIPTQASISDRRNHHSLPGLRCAYQKEEVQARTRPCCRWHCFLRAPGSAIHRPT